MKDDDKFLACALASGAGIIVSGDKHLLSVTGYRGVEILRPRARPLASVARRKYDWPRSS